MSRIHLCIFLTNRPWLADVDRSDIIPQLLSCASWNCVITQSFVANVVICHLVIVQIIIIIEIWIRSLSEIERMEASASLKLSYYFVYWRFVMHLKGLSNFICAYLATLSLKRRLNLHDWPFQCSPQIPYTYSFGFTCDQHMQILLTKDHMANFKLTTWVILTISCLCPIDNLETELLSNLINTEQWLIYLFPISDNELVVFRAVWS